MKSFCRNFYQRDTVTVARELLGHILVRNINGTQLMGRIIETEAYRFDDDPASHAFRGRTQRNKSMFGPVGHAYVYFIYGNHFCFNVVAKAPEIPAGAVLIRAVKPIGGLEIMAKNRKTSDIGNLTSGPGKLTQALQIEKTHNGLDVTCSEYLQIVGDRHLDDALIQITPRVGISIGQSYLWRFVVNKCEE